MTKFYNLSKLKPFADDKSNVIQDLKFVLERVENILGKRGNTDQWSLAFASFPTMLSKAFLLQVIESWHCVVKS